MLSTRFHLEDGKMVTQRTQDCVPIAEQAKALHNEGYHGSDDFKHAASIPMVFIEDYCNRNNLLMHDFMVNHEHQKRMLNDPALAHFRIWKGRL
jgi:hypothetical protein